MLFRSSATTINLWQVFFEKNIFCTFSSDEKQKPCSHQQWMRIEVEEGGSQTQRTILSDAGGQQKIGSNVRMQSEPIPHRSIILLFTQKDIVTRCQTPSHTCDQTSLFDTWKWPLIYHGRIHWHREIISSTLNLRLEIKWHCSMTHESEPNDTRNHKTREQQLLGQDQEKRQSKIRQNEIWKIPGVESKAQVLC